MTVGKLQNIEEGFNGLQRHSLAPLRLSAAMPKYRNE